jgi:hypothetical protein
MAILTRKQFKNEISKTFKDITKSNRHDGKKLMDASLCQFDKCNEDLIKFRESRLTDEERKKCEKTSNNKFIKQIKCNIKLLEKKGHYGNRVKLNHCIANKCPEDIKIGVELMKKNQDKKNKKRTCLKCTDELKKSDDANIEYLISSNECSKKYDNYEKYELCRVKNYKKYKKHLDNYTNCYKKDCENVKKSKKNKK